MAPGESDPPPPKSGHPPDMAEVEHTPFFRVAARTKNAQSSKWLAPILGYTLQQLPPRQHVRILFIFEVEFRFTFMGQKSQIKDLQAPFPFLKNPIIFNDLLAGASEHKYKKFFVFNFLNQILFLKSNLIY